MSRQYAPQARVSPEPSAAPPVRVDALHEPDYGNAANAEALAQHQAAVASEGGEFAAGRRPGQAATDEQSGTPASDPEFVFTEEEANPAPAWQAPAGTMPWDAAALDARLEFQDNLAGTDTLRALMATIGSRGASLEERLKAVRELALLRGADPAEYERQYMVFLHQRTVADAAGDARNNDVDDLDMERHAHFMGSVQQLRSGSYVGQALGIDPVFGALLNPTGGMVGAGNDAYMADPDSIASFHGEAHDAMGYLTNYQGIGPGYEYANPNLERPEANPLAGQNSGFERWAKAFEAHGRGEQSPRRDMAIALMGIGVSRLPSPNK